MKAMGICTGSASKVLQDFIESVGKGSDGWLTRADVIGRDAMGRPVVLDGVARMIKKAGFFEKKWVKPHGQKVALEQVLVTMTRRCRQSGGGVTEDLRVLQPIEAFGDFGEDGRLKSFKVRHTDTPLQKKVKRARVTRIEVLAVVLYTGISGYSRVIPANASCDRGLVSAMPGDSSLSCTE
jgi:hypothetical protein